MLDKLHGVWESVAMPKLWHDTIQAHRSAVADAIMDRTAALAAADDHHGSLGRLLHALPHVDGAHRHLSSFVTEIVRQALEAGELEPGASAEELARFALSAMDAAQGHSRAAVTRLVARVLKGLGAPSPRA